MAAAAPPTTAAGGDGPLGQLASELANVATTSVFEGSLLPGVLGQKMSESGGVMSGPIGVEQSMLANMMGISTDNIAGGRGVGTFRNSSPVGLDAAKSKRGTKPAGIGG